MYAHTFYKILFGIPFNRILCSSPYAVSLTHSVVWQGGERYFSPWNHRACDHRSRRKIRYGCSIRVDHTDFFKWLLKLIHSWDDVECIFVWRCEAHWRRDRASLYCSWKTAWWSQEKDHGQDDGNHIEIRNEYQIADLWWQRSSSPMIKVHTGNTSSLRWVGGW